jgi:AraC-like DNA-binding protein
MKQITRDRDERTRAGKVAESTVRIAPTLAIPAVLRSLGADPAKVLAEAGFDLRLFDDPDNRISYAARSRLMGHCATRTSCPHFGLLVGQQAALESLGLVGLMVKDSPDVGTALRNLVRYLHLHVRGAQTSLVIDGNLVMFGYQAYQRRAEASEQVGDGATAVMCNILRDLCGREWKPVEVRFVHSRPYDVGPFRRFFGAPLSFNAEQYSVVFSAAWLGRRLPATDPALHRLLQREIHRLEDRHGEDFPEQVRSVLRTAVVTGHADANRIASLFSMSSYALARRLRAFGVGFRELVEETRFEISRQMLEGSKIEVSEIAAAFEYSNASAFTRAFRRWSGTTPARWRSERRHRR